MASPRSATASDNVRLPAEILRFRASERQLHWAIAVPFMVCYATALLLVAVYNPDPSRPYRAIFSWTHRLSGVCLLVLPLWTALRHRGDFRLHFRNIRTAWRWRLDDVRWLFLFGPATFDKRVVLPHQEKFNAGEKLNFMLQTATYPLFIITGFLIWLPGVAYLSWLLHLSMAALATPMILGHVFMATLNPDTHVGLKGMISGYVNRHWAEHHYRHWYDEHYRHLHRPPEPEPEPALASALLPAVKTTVPAVEPAQATAHKTQKDKELPANSWPPIMRPVSGNRPVPETS